MRSHGLLSSWPDSVSNKTGVSMSELASAPAELLDALDKADEELTSGVPEEEVLSRLATLREATQHLTKKAEVLKEQTAAYGNLYSSLDLAIGSLQKSVEGSVEM